MAQLHSLSRSSQSPEDFDRWIRMATDNKINTTNSWDLALIDYFHDLSLLRDGDGINFQKASATLDGCVKIYSSRVDSAATETGRLINGLASSKAKEDANNGDEDDQDGDEDDEEGEDDEDEDLDEDGVRKKRAKKTKSVQQKSTLVEFKSIQIRKLDLELYVDPIFKKALTDFDEGGSKSLLINMLQINDEQRMVFDTAESSVGAVIKEDVDEEEENNEDKMDVDNPDVNNDLDDSISNLFQFYFNNFDLENSRICSTINDLNNVLNQTSNTSDLLKRIENFNSYDNNNNDNDYDNYDFDVDDQGVPSENSRSKTSIFFDDINENEVDDYGMSLHTLFNDTRHNNSNLSVLNENNDNEDEFNNSIVQIPDENLLAYFDERQKKNWAGPDHWKITKLKRNLNLVKPIIEEEDVPKVDENGEVIVKERKQKEHLIIDFMSDEFPDEEEIFTKSNIISLPKNQWTSKTKNLLPDDRHFSTKNFINLFLKEKLINISFNKITKSLDQPIDETLYANLTTINNNNLNDNELGTDFFNEDNMNGDDIDFGDDGGDGYFDEINPTQQLSSQFTLKTPSQAPINFARVAKKVDVKLLKDNLWKTLKQEIPKPDQNENIAEPKQDKSLKFSKIVTGLNSKYDNESKSELSTSFCFICLLHLANENGFTISNTSDYKDLIIEDLPPRPTQETLTGQ